MQIVDKDVIETAGCVMEIVVFMNLLVFQI